ncbi:glyoxalase/bleomycin resistance/dioxygenase family protein [Haladaptatus cibarius]|uniref:glyoxalase/bleomycin resistance/dioxygenase family protein n=1 Tax=Haladaptatus cibarius TaxID=453847 RepID=UPI000678B048|nr:glyoxalase/bleomycin resistance/dioxygenase family protein [Haladaptatus cibarius]
MSGIIFFASENRAETVEFYTDRLGADVWLEQTDCTILKYDNMLFGFCARDSADTDGILTFITDDRAGVDSRYEELADCAREEPNANPEYDIYHFFADDPEGRAVEVQTFDHETESV